MANELTTVRDSLRRALGIIDKLIAQSETPELEDPNRYRRYPGGPLNEAGEAEIFRRFDTGMTDSEIGLGMGIALTGVSKRRGMWRRQKARS
jgi:hypothetical protein